MAITFKCVNRNGWYFDRLLMKDEAFYGGIKLLHTNTIYKDYSKLFDPPSVAYLEV